MLSEYKWKFASSFCNYILLRNRPTFNSKRKDYSVYSYSKIGSIERALEQTNFRFPTVAQGSENPVGNHCQAHWIQVKDLCSIKFFFVFFEHTAFHRTSISFKPRSQHLSLTSEDRAWKVSYKQSATVAGGTFAKLICLQIYALFLCF